MDFRYAGHTTAQILPLQWLIMSFSGLPLGITLCNHKIIVIITLYTAVALTLVVKT